MMTNSSLQRARDILWQHRRELPAFRALIRAIEHRLLVDLGPLPQPLLDIGCGDGHFAEVTIKHAAVGIDIAHPSLVEAKRRNVYDTLDVASAWNIPYRSGSFGAVLANCAVEHMPKLDGVFGEVARVLRPGGKFIFSVPTDKHNANLMDGKRARSIGRSRSGTAVSRVVYAHPGALSHVSARRMAAPHRSTRVQSDVSARVSLAARDALSGIGPLLWRTRCADAQVIWQMGGVAVAAAFCVGRSRARAARSGRRRARFKRVFLCGRETLDHIVQSFNWELTLPGEHESQQNLSMVMA